MQSQLKLSTVFLTVTTCFSLGSSAVHAARPTPERVFGPDYRSAFVHAVHTSDAGLTIADTSARLRYWNGKLLQANAVDHTPPFSGATGLYGEQFGPAKSSRAFAIVQLAVFDAYNAVLRRYPSYSGLLAAPSDSSADAAIARAARDTLAALYPSQAASFNDAYQRDLLRIPDGRAKNNGVETGRRAAAAILALRAGDGYAYAYQEAIVGVDYFPSNLPGRWRQDPVSRSPLALGANWETIKPFVIPSAADFRPPAPPALSSSAYAAAFQELRQLGGDGVTTPTARTPQQTVAGIYWAYDGTPGLGSPSRLYNQIALTIANNRNMRGLELARMLALVNAAVADATLVAWDMKYDYAYWRPVTAIREASPGTSPTGDGDGNTATQGDVRWTPLGAPASNTNAPNFTPPFPAYPSGHAALGSALFQMLRLYYGTDQIAFTFVSDEYNGVTRDNRGNVRPRLPRSFQSLNQAEAENGQSRIYLGVHWQFDRTAGSQAGRRVASYVFQRGLVRP